MCIGFMCLKVLNKTEENSKTYINVEKQHTEIRKYNTVNRSN